jgi:hypothetical protein
LPGRRQPDRITHACCAAGGGSNRDCLIVVLPDEPTALVACHFGGGIVTIALPAVFRPEPGHDLVRQGPPNAPRRPSSARRWRA